MGSDPLKKLILQYLIKVKEIVTKNGIELVHRDKNLKSIASMGMTIDDVKDYILSLTPQDYLSGPTKDHDSSQKEDVFEYIKVCDGKRIYIKLKIINNNKEIVRCISFHLAEY